MKIPQVTDNGHVLAVDPMILPYRNHGTSNRNTSTIDSQSTLYSDINRTTDSEYNHNNYNVYNTIDVPVNEEIVSNRLNEFIEVFKNDADLNVCNIQYRIGAQNNINLLVSSDTAKVKEENVTQAFVTNTKKFKRENDVSSHTIPFEEAIIFDRLESDEMFENESQKVPRGIVNPNYPGFQHLAHTLQDYSSNIENFYQSENEMTDDDVEISDSTCDQETNQNETPLKNTNNNEKNCIMMNSKSLSSQTDLHNSNLANSRTESDLPDLLQTVSENNNNNKTEEFDFDCLDTDIENNFHTNDIIGDFNKEIEDEIKLLLNYNINIQDDLKELRKDIQNSFAKPIENTINNISEVVNHVIKKLVETQSDNLHDQLTDKISEKNTNATVIRESSSNLIKNRDTGMPIHSFEKTENTVARPTFLLLEKNQNTKIADAFLSDGKEEINVKETDYDTENLRNNVENTIKQLSTELRKIIPNLDKMRECDRFWAKAAEATTVKNGNFNELEDSSNCYSPPNTMYDRKMQRNTIISQYNNTRRISNIAQIETREARDQKTCSYAKTCSRNDQMNTSVHVDSSVDESDLGIFDVYNIETALPKLDLDTIENHIKAAKEAERRKSNDREEIRKRLAMGVDSDEYYSLGHIDRPGKKPSLHSRLQSGKNLQICFMNETASDNESQSSDIEKNVNYFSKPLSQPSIFNKPYSFNSHPYQTRPLSVNITKHDKITNVQSGVKLRPSSLIVKPTKSKSTHSLGHIELKESDFYALQATLQTEARIALAQAKEMARLQMEHERRKRAVSPVTEMLQRSMEKASAPLTRDRRRVSRQLLTDMNIAQLQVIVNELHSQIESLNEQLVKLLMARDELHMGQDSMLVDIEDLTRYLGVKEHTKKTKGPSKTGIRRLTTIENK